jgi:hypothetical protein
VVLFSKPCQLRGLVFQTTRFPYSVASVLVCGTRWESNGLVYQPVTLSCNAAPVLICDVVWEARGVEPMGIMCQLRGLVFQTTHFPRCIASVLVCGSALE